MHAPTSATVTVEEAAEMLGISRTEAYGWLGASPPLIPHQRRGSRYVIFRADVLAVAERGLAARSNGHADPPPPQNGVAAPDWPRLLADLLEGRDVAIALNTPLGRIDGVVHLAPR